jgi:magnesium transporter
MSQSAKTMAAKAALPPGVLIHVGEAPQGAARISILDYDTQGIKEYDSAEPDMLRRLADGPRVTWFKVQGVHQVETVSQVGEIFGLHPLVLEDLVNTHQRPKLEAYERYLFLVLKTMRYDQERKRVLSQQIGLILGQGFVLSFDQGLGDPLAPVGSRIHLGKGRIRRLGADYLAYAIMDLAVDSYYTVLEELETRIDDVEEDLFDRTRPQQLHELYDLKSEVTQMRKSIWPLREVCSTLLRGENEFISEQAIPFLRDLYDHTVQVIEGCDALREHITSLVDLHMNMVSNRMNEVMKVLTIIATIFIPLTFLAGIYGMNFKYMPELEQPWAYPLLLLLMAAVVVVMLLFFRRKKWL